jgi:hypothetical protein
MSAIGLCLGGCQNETQIPKNDIVQLEDSVVYSFFVAGHAYGNPTNFQYGLHPPFKNSIALINTFPKLELGVLTGDVVPKPTEDYWDSAEVDMARFNVPLHIAPGNHDKSPVFHSRYEDYYAFNRGTDLFLILSPRSWNIDGEQLDFVKHQIDSVKKTAEHIFIFVHELIWWTPENEYSHIEINYRPHYPGNTTYWELFQPYLDSLDLPVYLFAGDIGASEGNSPFMYSKRDNITYFATGMGSTINDNMIFVNVLKDESLRIELMGVKDGKLSLIDQVFGE